MQSRRETGMNVNRSPLHYGSVWFPSAHPLTVFSSTRTNLWQLTKQTLKWNKHVVKKGSRAVKQKWNISRNLKNFQTSVAHGLNNITIYKTRNKFCSLKGFAWKYNRRWVMTQFSPLNFGSDPDQKEELSLFFNVLSHNCNKFTKNLKEYLNEWVSHPILPNKRCLSTNTDTDKYLPPFCFWGPFRTLSLGLTNL